MKAHVIEGGKVINTIEVEALDFLPNLIDAEQGGKIGDDYDEQTGEFTTPAPVAEVPQVVTMRQATQALILAGLDDDVEALLAAMPGTEGKLARAEWQKSQVVERDRPLVAQMGAALGLTAEQIDQLFIQAAAL